mmetsp:Transcript_19431/g.28066  ORF Transcript_19431/g.28066 Transcript_19431/m.28066 type:complete len:295 (+) Transcript_19431:38-922(+)
MWRQDRNYPVPTTILQTITTATTTRIKIFIGHLPLDHHIHSSMEGTHLPEEHITITNRTHLLRQLQVIVLMKFHTLPHVRVLLKQTQDHLLQAEQRIAIPVHTLHHLCLPIAITALKLLTQVRDLVLLLQTVMEIITPQTMLMSSLQAINQTITVLHHTTTYRLPLRQLHTNILRRLQLEEKQRVLLLHPIIIATMYIVHPSCLAESINVTLHRHRPHPLSRRHQIQDITTTIIALTVNNPSIQMMVPSMFILNQHLVLSLNLQPVLKTMSHHNRTIHQQVVVPRLVFLNHQQL